MKNLLSSLFTPPHADNQVYKYDADIDQSSGQRCNEHTLQRENELKMLQTQVKKELEYLIKFISARPKKNYSDVWITIEIESPIYYTFKGVQRGDNQYAIYSQYISDFYTWLKDVYGVSSQDISLESTSPSTSCQLEETSFFLTIDIQ
mgnify:CR=1 FL=1